MRLFGHLHILPVRVHEFPMLQLPLKLTSSTDVFFFFFFVRQIPSLAQQEMLYLFLTAKHAVFQLGHMGGLQLAHRKPTEANTEITNNMSSPPCRHTVPEEGKKETCLERSGFGRKNLTIKYLCNENQH